MEISRLEHDLSVARFKLSKAEDFEIKYDILFKDNQKAVADYLALLEEHDRTQREQERAGVLQEQTDQQLRTVRAELDAEKREREQQTAKKEELRSKTTSQGQEEREALKESFARELDSLKKEHRDVLEKLKRENTELRNTISHKEVSEGSLAAKLEHIKGEKNSEIARLKELVSSLKEELGSSHVESEEAARQARSQLISETEGRIGNVRRLAQLIEETLQAEIVSLNASLAKKNEEIAFLLESDKRQLESHESSETALKNLVAKLEDKIFTIQRESELELYQTIQRLKAQYQDNLQSAAAEWEETRLAHNGLVGALRKEIDDLGKELKLLNTENVSLERQCKQLAQDQEHSVNMLSQKIIGMETERDQALKNYTTSMKQIEDDAKTKLDDLHAAMQTKNNESEILNAQITLKNGEIAHLLEEISRLRDLNRQKLKKLETAGAAELNALNAEIADHKRHIQELKRNLHETENQLADDEAAHQLQQQITGRELQAQKEANELLRARNHFLAEWCSELDRDLKTERVANVNILHDQNLSQRENVQVREEVRVELQALKEKEVEQLKNVHKLEKNRLENELSKREHELRDKKEELARLLVQYKALEAKVGKSSRVDRSAEDEGKCRATLEAEILLTENIFNAINRQ